MTRRYALRDDQWERIKNLLLGRPGYVGVNARDNRLFVEAVLWRYRSGAPWRDLPERFGDFRVVHTRFSRWSKTGVWKRVFEALAEEAGNEYAMIDSTIVRAHQHSAGAKKAALIKRLLAGAAEARARKSTQPSMRSVTPQRFSLRRDRPMISKEQISFCPKPMRRP
jgi:transposase